MSRFSDLYKTLTGKAAKVEAIVAGVRETVRQAAEAEYHRRRLKRTVAEDADTPEDRFLNGTHRLTIGLDFQSSNPPRPAVYQVWYSPKEQAMHVLYFDHSKGGLKIGKEYRYWTVTRTEAEKMYRDASKGISIWDDYRIRKTLFHKKNYAPV